MWRSFPFILFLAGFWATVIQNNAATYIVRTDNGYLLDVEWESGSDDWHPGERVILTTGSGEGYMFNSNNRTQVDVFPYNP